MEVVARCQTCGFAVPVTLPDGASKASIRRLSVQCRTCAMAGEPRRRARRDDSEPPEPMSGFEPEERHRPRRDWLNLNAEE